MVGDHVHQWIKSLHDKPGHHAPLSLYRRLSATSEAMLGIWCKPAPAVLPVCFDVNVPVAGFLDGAGPGLARPVLGSGGGRPPALCVSSVTPTQATIGMCPMRTSDSVQIGSKTSAAALKDLLE